jgi:hypothetical protein
MDFGHSFEQQAAVQIHLHNYEQGLRKGVSELPEWKRKYDA